KQGISAAVCSSIGRDERGEGIIGKLRNYDVGTDFMQRQETDTTGLSFLIQDMKSNEHIILMDRGANEKLAVGPEVLKKANPKWIYVSSLSGKNWYKNLDAVSDFVSKNDVKLAFNPGFAQVAARDKILKFLDRTDVIVLNKDEAIELTQVNGKEDIEDFVLLARKISKLGPKIVAITDGKKGAYVFDKKDLYFSKIYKVDTVDTTGAGDSFGSTFVAGLYLKNDIPRALKMAIVNSAAVTREFGAQNGLMILEEIDEKIGDVEVNKV
ncbi:MAG: ribokinase family sugar kinase, partial [uncultured bacterium]